MFPLSNSVAAITAMDLSPGQNAAVAPAPIGHHVAGRVHRDMTSPVVNGHHSITREPLLGFFVMDWLGCFGFPRSVGIRQVPPSPYLTLRSVTHGIKPHHAILLHYSAPRIFWDQCRPAVHVPK